MFCLWGKMMKENRMLRDIVISNGDYTMSRTAMVFDAIDQICYAFDPVSYTHLTLPTTERV